MICSYANVRAAVTENEPTLSDQSESRIQQDALCNFFKLVTMYQVCVLATLASYSTSIVCHLLTPAVCPRDRSETLSRH